MTNNNLSVCLLGATGFLGSAIAKELEARNISWIGISRNISDDIRIKKLNLSDRDEMINIFKRSDVVINALGSAKPKDFEENPQLTLNTIWENAVTLSSLLKAGNISKLVQISSAGTVYGEEVDAPHTEESNLLPISWYGKAKVIEELYLEKASESNQFDYLCCRVTNPYGNEKKTMHGFIDVLIHSTISGKKFSYYQDCNPIRDFIYADDMAFSIVELIEQNCSGIFNIGSGDSHSLEEIVNFVRDKFKGEVFIDRVTNKPSYDVLNNKVNVEKLIIHKAQRVSMDVFSYIDNQLMENTRK
ncbi:NAD-dependent epimerase/dehydratase family protein [Psychromonas hadalis]|uniref:NAD-dependent epimerase/dehydratase family protein n=1 Tax=Psychromonas hadalis TaxID=211669 RepID=UPI0003B703D3|nr:NAD-dependent epimerase/dehydratase family protein [Psychromonas hadalis]